MSAALRRLATDRGGSTAVEFAMVLMPFLAACFALLETSLMLIDNVAVSYGSAPIARQIRTGQLQDNTGQGQGTVYTQSGFLTYLRSQFNGELNTNLVFADVRVVALNNIAAALPDVGIDTSGSTPVCDYCMFQTGTADSFVAVRVFYVWQPYMPGLSSFLGNFPQSVTMQTYTTIFRNEPYP